MYGNKEYPTVNRKQSVASERTQTRDEGAPIFGFADNRPEVIAQRKLQKMGNNASQVKKIAQLQTIANCYSAQQPTLQKKGASAVEVTPKHSSGSTCSENSPVQRAKVAVGFDGSNTQSMFAGPGNVLSTSGVANCIAVVVWDTGGQGAVMRHYDTVRAATGNLLPDAYTNGNALEFDAMVLAQLRADIVAQLNLNIAPTGLSFAISVGSVWVNVDTETSKWQSRMNLLTALKTAFDVEPSRGGSTASFDTTTNVLGG